MRYLITFLIISNLSLFSQSWIQTSEIDTVQYRHILTHGISTYLFTYISRENGILRSTDDGVTWDTLVDGNPEGYEEESPSVSDMIDENTAITCLGSNGNLFKYDFNNDQIEHFKLDATRSIMSIKMLDKDNGICGSSIELFITDDGWKSTKKKEVNKLEEVYIRKLNSKIEYYYLTSNEFMENKSRLYISNDSGDSWNESILGEYSALDMIIKEDGSILVTCGKSEVVDETRIFSDIILKSTNNGKTWEEKLNKSFDHRVDLDDINFYNDQIGMACGQNTSTYLTFDGGGTWELQNVGEVEELSIRPTFGGFTQTKFILGVWNNGIYQKSISTSSVNSEELAMKYSFTLLNNILNFQNYELINYEVYNLAGQLLKKGNTYSKIDLNQLEEGVYLININNEFTVKFIR